MCINLDVAFHGAMFTQVTPILAADDDRGAGTQAILSRFEALELVIATLAKLTGNSGAVPDLAASADLADAITALPPASARRVATECDTIAIALTTGLTALESARHTGRLNLSAAHMLHAECAAAIAGLRSTILASGQGQGSYTAAH